VTEVAQTLLSLSQEKFSMQKFDEMYTRLPYEFFSGGKQVREHYKMYDAWLARQPGDTMAKRRAEAEMIFRRVDDGFLDPKVFRCTSTLGCAGLLDVYKAGHINICNGVGTGVADANRSTPMCPG